MKTIVWMREDLRLEDNFALHYAARNGQILPIFIYPDFCCDSQLKSGSSKTVGSKNAISIELGAASKWWLHHSLKSLQRAFSAHNVELILRRGNPEQILPQLVSEIEADAVVWNRVYSPAGMADGKRVKAALERAQVEHLSFNAQLLIEPSKVFNKQGKPYKVFTPFWRHCLQHLTPEACVAVADMRAVSNKVSSEELDNWQLLPTRPDWSSGLQQRWQPGEQTAHESLALFLQERVNRYNGGRDFPALENTSMLSPHLVFGEIGPRQIWFAVHEGMAAGWISSEHGNKFLSEIGWREFARYLLVHFPHLLNEPFNSRFTDFPWQDDPALIEAWQQGQTGYPIVDAGMRELWHTGYMHNRVRMVVASFLTKHCISHWQHGMAWFWDTLVDADIGNNTASWQWAAGCGADAAPYFRIFNPILQGEKFDKEGVYIKKWVPELSDMPARFINKPWQADGLTLQQAGVVLGETYPLPIVEHKEARERALLSYQQIKK